MALTKAQQDNADENRRYWQDREDEALKHYITDEAEYDRHIQAIYANMLDNVQKEIDSFYARYASAEGITLAEAKHRVSQADIAAYERKAERYVREKNFSAQANEEMRLYNAMMRINRLEMLKANIGLETIAGHDELEKYMAGILQGRTMEELERQAGILGKSVQNNAAKAHAIVNGSFKNGTFSDRIWQYQDAMREDLGKLLQTGLIQGKNPRALASDLRKYWYGNDPRTGGGARYCMERLMRTELARVQTEAQKQSFERNGFDKYLFIVNHNCCDICKELSKKDVGYGKGVFLVEDMMPGDNAPPVHPHCRCSTAAYEDDDEYEAWLNHLATGGTTAEWEAMKSAKLALENSENGAIIKEREMANGMRKSYLIPLSDADKEFVTGEIDAIGADRKHFIFRDFRATAYSAARDKVFVSSSVFPSADGSTNPTDMLSVRATLAHEYYGHRAYRNTQLREGAWNDEFRASYMAAQFSPGLSDEDRAMLISDALQRAKDAGVNIKLNSFMRRCLYGYE